MKGLTEEQKNKVKECKSSEEILALAKAEGVTLTDEQLEAVSGGICHTDDKPVKCPECGSKDLELQSDPFATSGVFKCRECGHRFVPNKRNLAPWA